MTLTNTVDLLYLILAIAVVWVGVFLAWFLFEAALMAHRANRVVRDALARLGRFERAVESIKDRVESSASYFGALAEGGKMVMSMMEKSSNKKKGRKSKDNDEDDE